MVSTLTAFPNPTSGDLTVDYETSLSGSVEVRIFNMIGACVFDETVSHNASGQYRMQLPLEQQELAPGLYTLRMMIDGEKHEMRIVKE